MYVLCGGNKCAVIAEEGEMVTKEDDSRKSVGLFKIILSQCLYVQYTKANL
jgi:hypothetical protein